jgi:homocysteine S-methyltransferase
MLSDRIRRVKDRLPAGLILDGGLATELESLGLDLDHPLWSARVLIDEPDAILAVHIDYLLAGADCITTSSYQASIAGLEEAGLSRRQIKDLLRKSVRLAQEARDFFLQQQDNNSSEETSPLVAASCGPYGAYLADGSEFTGDYDLSENDLYDFHSPRFEILAEAQPDLLAFETIPQAREAKAIARLLKLSTLPAWVSFSCRDGEHLVSGEPIEAALAHLHDIDSVVAVGVNCVSPGLVLPIIETIRRHTHQPIVVYPNAGGTWDDADRSWVGGDDLKTFISLAKQWRSAGASLIGGCCQITPEHIKRLKSR